jgi:hypothetical protein
MGIAAAFSGRHVDRGVGGSPPLTLSKNATLLILLLFSLHFL